MRLSWCAATACARYDDGGPFVFHEQARARVPAILYGVVDARLWLLWHAHTSRAQWMTAGKQCRRETVYAARRRCSLGNVNGNMGTVADAAIAS